jgi:Uma2 family endonuclease
MGQTAKVKRRHLGGRLRLSYVPWQMYTRLLRTFEERPGIRLTFDRGELEIMSPLLEHDDDGRFLGRLVMILTEEFELPIHGGGSTTLRRQLKQKGLEPDESFWIAHAPQMAGVRRLDLRIHPPPDLAIEVDVTNSSLDRMGIYAALSVPEVWRLDDGALTFHVLDADNNYRQSDTTPTFAGVMPGDLIPFLRDANEAIDQNQVTRRFRDWVKQRRSAQ